MAWFGAPRHLTPANNQQILQLAQITDCHLFGDDSLFDEVGVDSLAYLQRTLAFLATQSLDGVIFSGDLTQDHTDASFLRFAKCYRQHLPDVPLYWLPGNHDEMAQLEMALTGAPFEGAKHLIFANWQVLLLNSKGPTPSGLISEQHFTELTQVLNRLEPHHRVLCFCHHHPLPVNAYIDKHGLTNGAKLVAQLLDFPQVKALAYGHVHQFRHDKIERKGHFDGLSLYATAATSVQFTAGALQKTNENLGPACRLFTLEANGGLTSDEIYLFTLSKHGDELRSDK